MGQQQEQNLNGANGTPPPPGEGEPNAEGLTEGQRSELVKLQNAAQSAHWTRMTKVFDQKMSDMQNAMTETFQERLAELGGTIQKGAADKAKAKAGGEGDPLAEIKAQYDARLQEMENKYAEERKAREGERATNRRQEERTRLAAALAEAGVPQERVRSAVALLYTEDKRIGRDDDDNIVFKMQRDGYTDNLEVGGGIEEWLKSSEGKHYAPVRDVRGSGAIGGRPGLPGNKKPSKQELKRELMRNILEAG